MHTEYTVLMGYLQTLDFAHFYLYILNSVTPYGMFWWLLSLCVFGICMLRTKNLAYATGVLSLWLVGITATGFVTNGYVAQSMQYLGIIIGIGIGVYFYRMLVQK
jgi:hypothetical protein